MILHLGVIEQPYTVQNDFHRFAKAMAKAMGEHGAVDTTGDVAEILEAKYHIMEIFAEVHAEDIAKALEDGLAGRLESIMMGSKVPAQDQLFAAGETKINAAFKVFLLTGEMEKLAYPGVPTKAALKGVNHRLAHPYAKGNPRRKSFIDTGLYEASFKSWVETTD